MSRYDRHLHRLLHRIEQRLDAQKERLAASRAAAQLHIAAYRGFGSHGRWQVSGRVLRGAPIPRAGDADRWWRNLYHTLRRLETDEVPGARLLLTAGAARQEVVADEEGYFQAVLQPGDVPGAAGTPWREATAELLAPAAAAPVRATLAVLVPPAESAFGVISDLDDTVLRSDATDLFRMARTVLLGNARTRLPFPGVAAFYRALQQGAAQVPSNPIFYVSSSPWNLYELLDEFLEIQGIPAGPLLLRDWGLNEVELLPRQHREHKLKAIRRVMEAFPALPFLLIGDSGQEDPEVYREVVATYPGRVLAIYIRDVTPEARDASVRALAAELEAEGIPLLLTEDTAAAAAHAAGRGWITAAALAEVRAATQASAAAG